MQLVDTGPDVRMNIDADGGAGNGFELALLTFAMASPTGLTVGTAAGDDIQVAADGPASSTGASGRDLTEGT